MPSSAPTALDIRPLPPPRKPVTVLAAFDRLRVGESFLLVDDSNPSAICCRLEGERPGKGRWVYLRDGPPVWHVRITRQNPASETRTRHADRNSDT